MTNQPRSDGQRTDIRGWNDPPKLSFTTGNQHQTSSSTRLRMMKKRIPVPLNKELKTVASTVPPLSKPPQDSELSVNPNLRILEMAASSNVIDEDADDIKHFSEVEDTLLELFEKLTYQNILKDQVKEDIMKRITALKEAWSSGHLPSKVQIGMISLSKALRENDYKLAWSLHQGLIVEHTHICSNWMLGVKTLISEAQGLEANAEGDGSLLGANNNEEKPLFLNPSES